MVRARPSGAVEISQMSRFVADRLTDALLTLLSVDHAIANADRAIVICTIDEHGWPHPAMLTSLEIVARDARNVRVAIHARSRSARNMQANARLTLILADQRAVHYVKGDVRLMSPSMAHAPDIATFNLRVDSVLEDSPTEYEHAHIVNGIRVERSDFDPARAGAVLRELLEEHKE